MINPFTLQRAELNYPIYAKHEKDDRSTLICAFLDKEDRDIVLYDWNIGSKYDGWEYSDEEIS